MTNAQAVIFTDTNPADGTPVLYGDFTVSNDTTLNVTAPTAPPGFPPGTDYTYDIQVWFSGVPPTATSSADEFTGQGPV